MPIPKQDYSKFNELSTQTLMDIIRKDSFLPDGEEFDQDFIKYITEVIAERNKETPIVDIPDVDKAWNSFLNDYLGKEPLYGGDLEGVTNNQDKQINNDRRNYQKAKWKLARAVCIAAVVTTIVIFMGSVTAYAMGYDLWGNIATWTSETFRFKSGGGSSQNSGEKEVPEVIQDFKELAAENGVPDSVLPGWLPKGYSVVEMKCYDTGEHISVYCFLENNDGAYISLKYILHYNDECTTEYQKNEGPPEVYEHNGKEYGIMQNVDTYFAVWLDENIECTISGFNSRDELIRVINSI